MKRETWFGLKNLEQKDKREVHYKSCLLREIIFALKSNITKDLPLPKGRYLMKKERQAVTACRTSKSYLGHLDVSLKKFLVSYENTVITMMTFLLKFAHNSSDR